MTLYSLPPTWRR